MDDDVDDVEMALTFFQNSCLDIHTFRIKGRDKPWFTSEISNSIHERNVAWAKARRTTGFFSDS